MALYETLSGLSSWGWPLLANHLWQATLFSLLALAASRLLRRAPAGTRYFVWATALVKFALPSAFVIFLAQASRLDLPALTRTVAAPAPGVLAVSPLLSPVSPPPPAIIQTTEAASDAPLPFAVTRAAAAPPPAVFYSALTLVWLVGCGLLLVSWCRQRRRLSASLREARALESGREAEALGRVLVWLGRRRRIRLVASHAASEPGVWRVWRPTIVLPEGIADEMEDGELETVLMHEVAHVERWDNLAGNVQRFLCCVFWFHPLVWLIDRRLLCEREQACDDAVVRLSGASETYAKSIAKVCRHCVGGRVAGVSGAAGSDLKRRIERILSEHAGGRSSVPQLAIVGAVAAAALTLSVAAGHVPAGELADRVTVVAGAATAQDSSDARFEVGHSAQPPAASADGSQLRAVSAPRQAPVEVAGVAGEVGPAQGPPLEVYAGHDSLESSPSQISDDTLQPRSEMQPPPEPQESQGPPEPRGLLEPPVEQPARIQAAIVNAADAEYGDLRRFIGRYEVDPERAENFVLDVTLEYGELWLKPSHTDKRRLIRRSETSFSDSSGKFQFTAILDGRERVVGLRLDSWGRNVVARKLALPRPSLTGKTTFRLKGYPHARIVAVAGTFNDWNQSQLLFAREGDEWVCRVNLPPGTYQYKFIVDGNWLTDPSNPRTVHDERKILNSLLRAD